MQRFVLKRNHGGSHEGPAKPPGTNARPIEAEVVESKGSKAYRLLKAFYKKLNNHLRLTLGYEFQYVSIKLDRLNERVTVRFLNGMEELAEDVCRDVNHVLKKFKNLRFNTQTLVISHA